MAELTAPPSYDEVVTGKSDQPSLTTHEYPPYFNQYPPTSQPNPSTAQPYPAAAQPYPSTAFHPVAGGFTPKPYEPTVVPTAALQQPASHSYTTQGSRQPVSQPMLVNTSENYDSHGFTAAGTFDDKHVRRLFVRKVFITLGLQLLVTFGIICLFYFIDDVRFFVQKNAAVYLAAYGVFIVMYIILVCSTTAARKHPCNLIMLTFLTLAMSYMAGTICTFHNVQAVIAGFGITVVVCVTVIIFSMQTKYDFTKCGGLLFILVMVLFIFGFVTIFTYWRNWYLQVVYGALGALVFTLFLAFDTQLIMGGRKYELDPEEYIFGSLILYIDIIYIFLFILAIFGGSSR